MKGDVCGGCRIQMETRWEVKGRRGRWKSGKKGAKTRNVVKQNIIPIYCMIDFYFRVVRVECPTLVCLQDTKNTVAGFKRFFTFDSDLILLLGLQQNALPLSPRLGKEKVLRKLHPLHRHRRDNRTRNEPRSQFHLAYTTNKSVVLWKPLKEGQEEEKQKKVSKKARNGDKGSQEANCKRKYAI